MLKDGYYFSIHSSLEEERFVRLRVTYPAGYPSEEGPRVDLTTTSSDLCRSADREFLKGCILEVLEANEGMPCIIE
ncbi:hypothetical protein KIPB_013115, partial [Kipferlia bialata]|eukprot:g13115.t1